MLEGNNYLDENCCSHNIRASKTSRKSDQYLIQSSAYPLPFAYKECILHMDEKIRNTFTKAPT